LALKPQLNQTNVRHQFISQATVSCGVLDFGEKAVKETKPKNQWDKSINYSSGDSNVNNVNYPPLLLPLQHHYNDF